MSPTIILKGCIAMLMEVSRNIRAKSPNTIAAPTVIPKLPALGSRHITMTAMRAPMKRYGIRRPKRVQVRSLSTPIIGCTMIPANGGSIQKYDRLCGSAPSVAKIREMLALWRA